MSAIVLGTRSRQRVALFLPSLTGGGAERTMLNLAVGLSERGHWTDLVLACATGPFLPLVPAKVRVIDLRASRVLRSLVPLAAYLRRERPTALLAALDHTNLVAMAAARLARSNTRIVISIHAAFEQGGTIRERAIPWLLSRSHRWADAIVAVSEGVADDVATATVIPRGRISVIYNPVISGSRTVAVRSCWA
jgi:glycosyltransferase involved in cell wall biosynthesis